jgi:hypothetical protein
MRPVTFVALLGTTLSGDFASAQTAPEQRAANPAESQKKPPGTKGTDALTENGPGRPNALAEARREAAERKAVEAEPLAVAPSAAAQPAPAMPVQPMVEAVAPGPPQKNLTGEEFGLIHEGSTAADVLTVLGPPSSRVVIPDDDGHLRESLQYWVKGNPMGTVRLDNGRVVQIETKAR